MFRKRRIIKRFIKRMQDELLSTEELWQINLELYQYHEDRIFSGDEIISAIEQIVERDE